MERFSFYGLRFRLLLFVLLAFLPVMGALIFMAIEQRNQADIEARNNAFRLLEPSALAFERLISQTDQLLTVLTRMPAVRNRQALPARDLFVLLMKENPLYANIGAATADGNVFANALPFQGRLNISDRAYFIRAVKRRGFAVGDYQIGRISGQPSLNAAMPAIGDDGRILAVAFAAINLSWLRDLAAEARLPEGSVLVLTDARGTILVRYPDSRQWEGRTLAGTSLWRSVSGKSSGSVESIGPDRVKRIYVFRRLNEEAGKAGAHILVGIPKKVVLGQVNRTLMRNLALLAFIAITVLMVAWVASQYLIIQRIHALVRAAGQIGRGNLKARTGLPEAPDEMGALSGAFDRMAESLERYEERLHHSNRTLTALYRANEALIRMTDEEGLLQEICRIIVDIGGYRMAWAGFAENDEEKRVRPVAIAGSEEGYLDDIVVSWADNDLGHGPVGTAIRQGSMEVVEDTDTDPHYGPWREAAMKRGYRSVAAIPLFVEDRVNGAIAIYSAERGTFDDMERRLLQDLVGDLGFGMTSLRARRQLLKVEMQKRDFYRRTIFAATEGKLIIGDREEIARQAGSPLTVYEIGRAEEASSIRHAVLEMALREGMEAERAEDLVLCVGEAATNALKHAGGGTVSIHKLPEAILVEVRDNGPGIEALNLPEVALKRGYTTAASLGMGYKTMIALADRVYLATGPEGTVVALEMKLHPESEMPHLPELS